MSTYQHQYYADFGSLGEDFEITVEYHKTKPFVGSGEEPAEDAGFEIDAINAEHIGNLMGVYNQNGPFADDVNERVAENHEERE